VLGALTEAARADRPNFMRHLAPVLKADPGLAAIAPVLLYATLGQTLPGGAATAAVLWSGCRQAATLMPVQVKRALGSGATGPELGEELFERLLEHPAGTAFTRHAYEEVWQLMRSDRIRLAVPELLDWITRLDPSAHAVDPDYPLSLVNGQRRSHNANQIIRTPAWRRSDPDGALRVHPDDLATAGVTDGAWAAVVSPKGRLVARAEADASMRLGQVALPHGFGMYYPDGKGGRVLSGPRINLLTDALDRDPIAGTPHHKDMPARVEPATAAEAAAAERDSELVRALAAAEAGERGAGRRSPAASPASEGTDGGTRGQRHAP
jgi:anaerobic selenocysteine-containing dehydrogenase